MMKELDVLFEKKNSFSKKFRKMETDNIKFREDFISDFKKKLSDNLIECEIKLDENKIHLIFPSNSFYSKNITIDYMGGNLYLRIPSFNVSSPEMDSNNLNFGRTVVFLSQLFINEENDFITNIKKNIKKYYKNIIDLKDIKREIAIINIEINNIESKIKKENFFNNLQNSNFYYHYIDNRYTTNYYEIYYIKKINNKTCSVTIFKSRSTDEMEKIINNIDKYPQKRINKEKLFYLIGEYDIFNSDNFKEVVLRHIIKNNVEKIYKQKNLDTIKDMKKLCTLLFKVNAVNSIVPDNDTLSIISEFRHHVLKYGYIK